MIDRNINCILCGFSGPWSQHVCNTPSGKDMYSFFVRDAKGEHEFKHDLATITIAEVVAKIPWYDSMYRVQLADQDVNFGYFNSQNAIDLRTKPVLILVPPATF